MSRPNRDRKARFRAALALADMTREEFAAQLEVSSTHVFLVLTHARESERVNAAIDALIEKYNLSAA